MDDHDQRARAAVSAPSPDTDEWSATPPARPLPQAQYRIALYRNHRLIGRAMIGNDDDAAAFHAFVNGDAPAASTGDGEAP